MSRNFLGGFTGAPHFLQCEWTHKPTNQPIPWCRVLPKKLPQLVKNFPIFDDSCRFVAWFTRTNYLFPSWAISVQFKPCNPISWRFHSVLSSHLYQDSVPFYRWQLCVRLVTEAVMLHISSSNIWWCKWFTDLQNRCQVQFYPVNRRSDRIQKLLGESHTTCWTKDINAPCKT
jgi:hypothetical protein